MSKINHFKKCKLPNIISSNHVLVLVHIFVYDEVLKRKGGRLEHLTTAYLLKKRK